MPLPFEKKKHPVPALTKESTGVSHPATERGRRQEKLNMVYIGAYPGAEMRATAATPIYIGHMRVRSALSAGFRHRCISWSLSLVIPMPRLRALPRSDMWYEHLHATALMLIAPQTSPTLVFRMSRYQA